MDIERARLNMVESQVRPWEVLDDRVLDALRRVPREQFVPERYRSLAFADLEIPIGHGEVMLAPRVEARMLQELAPAAGERVLEVGTGSGYMAALLARFAAQVVSVERHADLSAAAAARLGACGAANVTLAVGNAARGWPAGGPYDAIVLTGSVPLLAPEFASQLRPGGRLVAVVGELPVMTAMLFSLMPDGTLAGRGLFEVCISPLADAPQPERFAF